MKKSSEIALGKPAEPRPSMVEGFLKGCARGFKIGIELITPAMILAFVLIYILNATGLMELLGTVFGPVMRVFGLPGEAFAVIIAAFFAKAAGAAAAAGMYAEGVLTLGQAVMMLPATMLMGTLIGHYARIVLVSGSNRKWHPLLLAIPLLTAVLSLFIMRIIINIMGVV